MTEMWQWLVDQSSTEVLIVVGLLILTMLVYYLVIGIFIRIAILLFIVVGSFVGLREFAPDAYATAANLLASGMRALDSESEQIQELTGNVADIQESASTLSQYIAIIANAIEQSIPETDAEGLQSPDESQEKSEEDTTESELDSSSSNSINGNSNHQQSRQQRRRGPTPK